MAVLFNRILTDTGSSLNQFSLTYTHNTYRSPLCILFAMSFPENNWELTYSTKVSHNNVWRL